MTIELAASRLGDQDRATGSLRNPEVTPLPSRQPDSIGSCGANRKQGCVAPIDVTGTDHVDVGTF
jgi:hypothetical protein